MEWSAFIEEREVRRERALRAADALAAGEPVALSGWRFREDAGLVARLLAQLGETPPRPSHRHLAASLAPPDALSPQDPAAERILRRSLARRAPASEAIDDDRHRLAWALDELDFVGAEVERRERAAWRETEYAPDADADARSAALWTGWFTGNPFLGQSEWTSLYLPAASRVFRGVLASRNLPDAVSRRAMADLSDNFFFFLLGGGEGAPGWKELAVRVIETTGLGPVDALAGLLDPRAWARLGACASRRGRWPAAAAIIWPRRGTAPAWAAALEQRRQVDPGFLESALDLHVALRLVAIWSGGATDPDRSWSVVTQNRGRARGRLRALSTGFSPAALTERFLGLDALHARTVEAVRRFAWAWAWQELARDFPFDMSRPVTPPCDLEEPERPTLSDGDRDALRTWVLLVCLKGHLPTLSEWILRGKGNRSATWGRLLTDDLPEALRDPDAGGRARTYNRVKSELAGSLFDQLDALQPLLEQIAALPNKRGLRGRFEALVADDWRGAPMPRAGFPTFLKNASQALTWLDELETDP